MENTINALQKRIDEARNQLTEESRGAIDSVNWKSIILGMTEKYNPEQLDDLETETELLLCGILNTDDYPKELQNRMKIPREEVMPLINELDKQIFKKIQAELEKRIEEERKNQNTTKPFVPDPSFINMPNVVQEAINKSNYKPTLYKIAGKYKLTVIQMGILEETTIKVMQNTLHPDEYGKELSSKITIPKEEMDNMIEEINTSILKKIVDLMKNQGDGEEKDEIPLPPYQKTSKNGELGIRKEIVTPIPSTPTPAETIRPMNIIEDKLKNPTTSSQIVSNYSTPKISNPSTSSTANNPDSKSHDPYREAIS